MATDVFGQPNLEWIQEIGSLNLDYARPKVAVDSADNIYIMGSANETGNKYAEDVSNYVVPYEDIWIAKYDRSGSQQWFKLEQDIKSQQIDPRDIRDAAVDGGGNIYIIGFIYSSGIWVAKYDSVGTQQWVKPLLDNSYGNDFYTPTIASDNTGNVYLTGGIRPAAYPIKTKSLIAKYDSNGNQQYEKQFSVIDLFLYDQEPTPYQTRIATDIAGNVYLAGTYSATDYNIDYPGRSYYTWIAKYDSSGNQQYLQQVATASIQSVQDIVVDSIGNFFIAGFLYRDNGFTDNAFVAQYDQSGKQLQFREIPINPIPNTGIFLDRSGNAYIHQEEFVSNAGYNSQVTKYNSSGIKQWVKPFTGLVTDIAFSSKGEVYVANDDGILGGTRYSPEKMFIESIFGTPDNDILSGSDKIDTIISYEGDDSLSGADDNDVLFANQGADTLDGGMGDDILSAGKDNDLLDDSLGNNYLNGNMGNDTVNGGDGNDELYGGKDNDILNGGNGNDRLSGDLGSDTLTGGAGSDRFVLTPTKGNEIVTDFTDGIDLLELTDGLTSELLTITPGTDATLIYLTDSGELLASLIGVSSALIREDDIAPKDNSINRSDYAHDTRLFKLNSDRLFFFGTPDNDTLADSDNNDTIIAYEGNDSLRSANGNDVLFGNQGADTLDGGMGDDSLSAGKDNDLLGDAIGNNYLNGNMGNDIVNGGAGNDTLYGGKDNDILNGGDGDDRLSGDFGLDTLTGGAGSDRFVLTPTKGDDIITDFADGSDRFELTDGLTFEQLTITSGSNATLITLTSTGELLASLNGVPSNLIGVEDFIAI